MSVADFNPYVSKGYCQTVVDAIELAKKIGAKKLNMHMARGAKYTLPDRVVLFFEAYEEDYLQQMRAFRDSCEKAIGDSGVMICVENTAGFLPFQQRAVELLLESPVFGLTFDIGHNRCAGDADEEFILRHKDRLQHFHIHDVRNGKQDHQTLGTGELDIGRYLTIAKERSCSVVLETKTVESLKESVAWVRNWEK
jgi:sugar phosphate isomerase/epimerase